GRSDDGTARRDRARRHVRRDLRPGAHRAARGRAAVTAPDHSATTRFINRELSWLSFNERVLEEAADATTPLAERVKFAAIVSSNRDEFFMVRVAGLRHAIADGEVAPDMSGMTPSQQLSAIAERTHAMVDRLYTLTFGEIVPALAAAGVRLVAWSDL